MLLHAPVCLVCLQDLDLALAAAELYNGHWKIQIFAMLPAITKCSVLLSLCGSCTALLEGSPCFDALQVSWEV